MGCRQGIRYAIKSAISRAFSNCLLCSWWFCFFVRKARRQRVHATSFDWNWTKEEAPQLWGKQKFFTQKISNSSFIYCRFRAPLCWTRLNGRYKMARWLRRASKKNLVGGVVLFWLTRNIAKRKCRPVLEKLYRPLVNETLFELGEQSTEQQLQL